MQQKDGHQPEFGPERTTTGLPIEQGFTPPNSPSFRKPDGRFQRESGLERLFPEEAKSRRPHCDTIRKPIGEVAQILANLRNFPEFFEHLEKVESSETGETKWHFRSGHELVLPMKRVTSPDANLFIWRSEDDAGLDYTLAIELVEAQANRGTIVRIMTAYASRASGLLAKLEAIFGEEANVMAKRNLQRFKAYCETGHVPTTEGQPSGRDEDSYILSPDPEQTTLKH